MSGNHRMAASKSATVAAVGEHAYKPALRNVPGGEVWVELIPEPDNPYDSTAISVRYRGNVIAYIPRDRTNRYWNNVCRIVASGKTTRIATGTKLACSSSPATAASALRPASYPRQAATTCPARTGRSLLSERVQSADAESLRRRRSSVHRGPARSCSPTATASWKRNAAGWSRRRGTARPVKRPRQPEPPNQTGARWARLS